MVVIYLIFIEIVKALAIGIVVGLILYLALRFLSPWRFWKQWSSSFILIFLSFLAAFLWPFVDLRLRFEDWAKAEEKICKNDLGFELSDNLPRERVAFYGMNKKNYAKGTSSSDSRFRELPLLNIKSIAVYDQTTEEYKLPSKKVALDGIEGKWKELWLEDNGHIACKAYEKWARENPNNYEYVISSQKRNGVEGKCVAIRVIEDEETINFLSERIKRKAVYRKPGFATDLVQVEVFNERTGEIYATLRTIESGWPRFLQNFRTIFVAKGASCPIRGEFRARKIDTSVLKSRIFTKDFK